MFKIQMKSLICLTSLVLMANVFADNNQDTMAKVNKRVAKLLEPITKKEKTKISVGFSSLDLRPEGVAAYGAEATYSKEGAENTLTFNVKMNYKNPRFDNSTSKELPKTTINVKADLNLLKLFSQKKLNMFSTTIEEMFKMFLQQYLGETDGLLNYSIKTDKITKDANENVTEIKLLISASLKEKEKIPAFYLANIPFESISSTIVIRTTGIEMNAEILSNLDYTDKGMKEFIEEIVAEKESADVGYGLRMFFSLDKMAENLVNRKLKEKPKN